MPYVQREEGRIVGLFSLPQPDIEEEFLPEDDAEVIAYNAPKLKPLELVTNAVKGLPVAKRTSPQWGLFINQCLLAIQHEDMEALGYLVNGYSTEDSDYLAILSQAKQLFGLE